MPCVVKSSFRTILQISLGRLIMKTPISLLTKTGFHASNQRSLLSDFELCAGILEQSMGTWSQVGTGLSYLTGPSGSLTVRNRFLGNDSCVGNSSPAMGDRNQVGIGLLYRPASLDSLATQFQTRFLESIPRPMTGT
jgi:hypothetical protein